MRYSKHTVNRESLKNRGYFTTRKHCFLSFNYFYISKLLIAKNVKEKEANSEICLKFLDSSNSCILSDICKHMHSYTLRRKAEIVTSLTPQHGRNHTQLDHSVACVIFFSFWPIEPRRPVFSPFFCISKC